MLNPQMMQMAQDMMSKMTPEQMQAMMRNMGNVNPGMMQQAMQQMQNMSPSDIETMRQQVDSVDPATMASQAQQAAKQLSAQQQYKYNASLQLKTEGNKLHSAAKYPEAAEKYIRAKANLSDLDSPDARDLRKACVLNLGSCYLNMGDYQQCVAECNEVLQSDPQNLKALYRRGQAHAALQHNKQAQEDLQRSLQLSAHDQRQQQLIKEKLKAVEDKLTAEDQLRPAAGGVTGSSKAVQQEAEDGLIEELVDDRPTQQQRDEETDEDDYLGMPVLEEISTEEQQQPLPAESTPSSSSGNSQQHWPTFSTTDDSSSSNISSMRGIEGLSVSQRAQMQQAANMMRANPEMGRKAAEMMKSLSAAEVAEMSRQAGLPMDSAAITEMQRTMSSINSEQMEYMLRMSTMRTDNPAAVAEAFGKNPDMMRTAAKMMQSMPKEQLQAALAQSGMADNVDPAMLSMATDAISKMPPEQLEQMAKMAASMQRNMPVADGSSRSMLQQPAAAAVPAAGLTGCGAISPAVDAAAAAPCTSGTAAAGMTPAPCPAGGEPAGADMSAMMTPDMMKMAAGMMQNIKPEALQHMMGAAGTGGIMRPGAEQMMTPEMIKVAASMMQNMKPEDFAAMQQMMGAGGAQGLAGMPAEGTGNPSSWTDMLSRMNPEVVESMFTSLQALDQDTLAQMCKGMAGSEEQAVAMASQIKKLSPSHVRMISRAAGAIQGGVQFAQTVRQWVASNLLLVIGIIVLIIAVNFRWYGVM